MLGTASSSIGKDTVITIRDELPLEHDDHTFMIHFDDGDVEDNVEWGRIEPMQGKILQRFRNMSRTS
ncbi:MAG: hypothetical protein Ct9H90mP16_02840 [Candidatus Poseidoniales archaeon]|nr:MAG: hypothetical protein Ct9H90mP16_02840 [Candidatus Poseidoniales archaeon]